MEKMRNSNLLKRILVLVLCLAIGVNMLPGGNYSVKVEAATADGVYNMKIGDATGGFHDIPANPPYRYSGLKDRTTLQIKGMVGGNESFLDGIKYTWTSSAPEVISVDGDRVATLDKYSADITRQGPGIATITVNFKPVGSDSTISISRVISVSTEIDKTSTTSSVGNRHPFTKLVQLKDDLNNTALIFNKNETDKIDKKEIELLNGTKSRTNTVKWTTSNSDIALVNQDIEKDTVPSPVFVTALKAGVATITAEAISDTTIKDSFKVLVMPTFKSTEKDENEEPIFVKTIGDKFNPVIMTGRDVVETNAIDATSLLWKVTDFNNTKTDLLKIEPEKDNKVYIAREPKAGTYKITAQTVASGIPIDDGLGAATLFAKVEVQGPAVEKHVLGLFDSYNLLENTNIQSYDDIDIIESTVDPKIISYDKGVITANSIGLDTFTFRIKDDIAESKYGMKPGDADYIKYVTEGVTLTFSVVDGFGINNSNITLPIKGTANLALNTSSSEPIKWVSKNESIVSITNANSKVATVTGLKEGKTEVTVTQKVNGVTKTATCVVNIVKSAETITIIPSSVDLNIDETKMLTAKLTPDNLLVGNLKWSSSDEKVVKIESANGANSIIKATGDGVAIITVINTENSIMATCKVTVYGTATGISVLPKDPTVNVGSGNLQLIAEITPATTVPPELSWISSDETVATVNAKGLVTLKKSGNARITVFVKGTQVSASTNIKVIKSVDSLKLEATSKVMYVGEKYKLGYTLTPADAVNKKINWKSTKPSVATVDSSGNIIGVSVGETVIIAQSDDGRYTDYCTIQVKQKAKNIKITTKDVTIYKGDVYDIKYTTDPVTATEVSVKWESMNTAVAIVTQTGKVTAVAVGSTIILAKTTSEEISYCNITVLEKTNGLKLNYNAKTVYKGKKFTLTASMIPETATNKKVKYVSSDTSIATVTSKGVVTGIKPGVALITVTSDEGGYKETCMVTVKELITKIKLNHTSYSVGLNQSFTIKPTVTSNASTNKKVKYTSSNSKVAYVNAAGKVTGRKLGTAKITVAATDGSGTKVVCTVKVVRPTTSVKLNRKIMTMVVDQSTRLTATISPKKATYKTVLWSSSDPTVARVLADGTITGLKPGETIITAKSRDNNGKKYAKCYVTVKEAVASTGITITTKNPVLITKEKSTARAAFTPYNSTDRIVWESDNSAVVSINRTSGTITAKRPGVATITAVSSSGKIDSTTVTVLGLNQTKLTIQQYDTANLSEVSGVGSVSWHSENPSVATVQNGYVIARKQGSTRIVATVRGRKLYCTVRVDKIS